jgi:hypothetical protein
MRVDIADGMILTGAALVGAGLYLILPALVLVFIGTLLLVGGVARGARGGRAG